MNSANNLFLRAAINQAQKSSMGFRHGAILIRGHKVIAGGYNRGDRVWINRSGHSARGSRGSFNNAHIPSTHAELEASRRILRPSKGLQESAWQVQ